MLKKYILLPALAFLVLGLAWLPPAAASDEHSPAATEAAAAHGNPAALVNGEEISRDLLESEVNKIRSILSMKGELLTEPQMEDLKHEVLEKLINYELLWQQSINKEITVSDQVVKDEVDGLKKQFPDEDSFKRSMADMNISENDLKLRIKKNIAVRDLLEQEVTDKITVTREESEVFYNDNSHYFLEPEQVKTSHILIEVSEDATEEEKKSAKKSIEALETRLKQGEDFGIVAREASQCSSSIRGGDLGFLERNSPMDQTFLESAFVLQPGEMSPVTETQFGYHIIKVTDRKPERLIPFEDVKDDIDNHLEQQKTAILIQKYLEYLEKGATIERFL